MPTSSPAEKPLLIIEGDSAKLAAQGLSCADRLARGARLLGAEPVVIKARSTADLLDGLGRATADAVFDAVVLIGHGNEDGIVTAPDRELVSWGELAVWLEEVAPERVAFICCKAGRTVAAHTLFDGLEDLSEVYAEGVPMQSSAPLIKNLVRLSLLERVSPELLVRFLRPYEGYLAGRGVSLDGVELDHAWVGELHRVLCVVDPTMPGALQQTFLDVADLASEQGHEAALNLAGERQLNLFGTSGDVSPEDLAFRLYLEHADVFMATHARVQSQEARRFVDFHPDAHRPLEGAETQAKRVLLMEQLRRWFASRNRSDYVDVRVSESSDEVSFVIIHGQPLRNLSVITSASSRDRLSLVPDKQDTVVFDKATGRLSINAQYAAELNLIAQNDGRRCVSDQVFCGTEAQRPPKT